MYRETIKIDDIYDAFEFSLRGPAEMQDWFRVFPDPLPEGHSLIYQWLPPRRDGRGNPVETGRLRVLVVPIVEGAASVSATALSKTAEISIPKGVKSTTPITIPAEVKTLSDPEMDTLAPQIGARYGANATRVAKEVAFANAIGKKRDLWDKLFAKVKAKRDAALPPKPELAESTK